MNAHTLTVDASTMLPDLLTAHPRIRPILDRYGLKGCGGPLGPAESLEFFARAHNVPLGQLLYEIRQTIEAGANAPEQEEEADSPAPSVGDTIYRPFFKSGIAIVLTLGAVWGAYLLLRIAFLGSFTAVGIHEVNAHGHAQIFGWIGLFVMGFAYQAFPRFKHTSLAFPRLALATLWLMLAGIILRSTFEAALGVAPGLGLLAIAGGGLEIVAIGLFIFIVATTWKRSSKRLAFFDAWIIAALVWFVVQAVYETVYFGATLGAGSRDELLHLVATYQAALREVQIHGFAMLMVLGVSQYLLPHIYGAVKVRPRASYLLLGLINLAVVGEVAGLILMRLAGHQFAALWYPSVLLLAGATTVLVFKLRVFRAVPDPDRSLKFIRAAYVWLLVSLAMMVALPFYQFFLLPALSPGSEAVHTGFSHAFYGAARHAITVGFLSLMIVGVAAKVVPTLSGFDIKTLPALWLPFVLINVGCAWRVSVQIATDLNAASFPIVGVSGLLEVTGLAIWGAHLWRLMVLGKRQESGHTVPGTSDTPRLAAGEAITASSSVGAVLATYPSLLDTFLAYGFTPLRNPALRRTLARRFTIEQACRNLGVDRNKLLTELNAALTASSNNLTNEPVKES